MTQEQFEILEKYAKRYDIYQRAKTLTLEHSEKKELADLRMVLRKSATNISCMVCVIEMVEDLFKNEYIPYKIAKDNLEKQLKESQPEREEQKQPLKRKRK